MVKGRDNSASILNGVVKGRDNSASILNGMVKGRDNSASILNLLRVFFSMAAACPI